MSEKKCQRCGLCCKSTFFALTDVHYDDDIKEIGRWAQYHGVQITRYTVDGIDRLGINIPGECKFLVKDNDGMYSCAIYEKRPEICKQYFCKRCEINE